MKNFFVRNIWVLAGITGFFIIPAVILPLVYTGIVRLNRPSEEKYPVRGVDVSYYQGDIDWNVLAGQDIDFAFIKATEGSAHTDPKFAENWKNAAQTGLYIGAYHFFSYDSSGAAQAENFINTVTPTENILPPAVDIEFYGDKNKNPPSREETRVILDELLEKLETHYGRKPIIYATGKSYKLYISGGYVDYPIWIRDVYLTPSLPDNRSWTFWQFSNKEKLDGYNGEEKYIDMNVFCGSEEEFAVFVK